MTPIASSPRACAPAGSRRSQAGVVLIMALIMLVVISLLATLSIRNATSGEAVSGNVRTTALANQAAEIALRYCEDTLAAIHPPVTVPVTAPMAAPAGWNELAYSGAALHGTDTTKWDGGPKPEVFLIPLTSVNSGSVTFHRAPECMVESIRVARAAAPFFDTTSTYVITARGFGPEVDDAVATVRARPQGTEVWLQSTVELN